MDWSTEQIHSELLALADPDYQKFTASLLPGCKNILGVRLPLLREMARRIAASSAPLDYLEKTAETFFEDIMLKGLVIGNLHEDIRTIMRLARSHIGKITNWSLCDSFCSAMKIVRSHRAEFWSFLTPYWQSRKPFEVRTAVVLSLFYYIDGEYIDRLFTCYENIRLEEYYAQMAVGWAVSMCFVQFPEKTLAFLSNSSLEKKIYDKALQKICESRQVDNGTKDRIRAMRSSRSPS